MTERPDWWPLYKAALSETEAMAAESMARHAARHVRAAVTDEQWKELLANIVEVMAFYAGKITRVDGECVRKQEG